MFANGPGDRGSIPGRVIPKTQKMVLDAALLNTQHYKIRIKGTVEQSREWSSALPYTSVLELLKREPSGHPRLRSPTLLTLLTCNFLFLQEFWCFPDLPVPFLPLFSFHTFDYKHNTFFNTKFHSYILAVYSYCLYQGLQFFSFFSFTLISSMYIKRFIFSCDFVNL